MGVTQDIVATYGGPRRMVRRILNRGENEGRALAILMAGCLVVFIAQWPRLSREAHLNDQDLYPLLGGALLAWMFIMPLVLYLLAFVSHVILRALRGMHAAYDERIALFWALLASGPLLLLNGLVAGFIGPGPGLTLTGALWLGVFLWFWVSGLTEAGKTQT